MKNENLRGHLIAIVRSVKVVNVVKPVEKKKKKKTKDTKPKSKSSEKKDVRAHLYSRLDHRLSGVANQEKEQDKTKQDKENEFTVPITSAPIKEETSNSVQTVSPEEQQKCETPDFKLIDKSSIPDNIIDIILICEEHIEPWKSLFAYGTIQFHPLLAALAGCYENSQLLDCHCLWYICSVKDDVKVDICKNLLGLEVNIEDIPLALQTHIWVQKDLLTVMKSVLKEGIIYAKLMVQGFKIFRENDVLIHILDFFGTFIREEEASVSLEKVKKFQAEYEQYPRTLTEDINLKFIEEFSYQCLQVLLSLCNDQYHVRKFVGLLADANYGHLFTLEVPDYAEIRRTLDIIYKTIIQYPVKKLVVVNDEFDMQHIHDIFDKILKAAYFKEAKELADIHCLSESKITLQKAIHDFEEISQTKAWQNISIRSSFMNKVDKTFFENKCSCDLAGSFFKEQANNFSDKSLYTYGERAFLLLLAMKWYQTSVIVDTGAKLNELEKQVWMFQIKAEVESRNTKTSKSLPVIQCTLPFGESCDISCSYFQRTCSDITMTQYSDFTELLQEIKEPMEEATDCPLLANEEEYKAFERFIGKLLDENCITEAQRVAEYFKRTTIDLQIVLAAISLAQGNHSVDGLSDDIKSILAETTSRHITITDLMERSGNFSKPETLNISSIPSGGCMKDFVFVEEIQNALEKLAIRINYGKKCLKQVLVSFKIANMLSMSYEDAVTEDCFIILRQVLEKGIDQRRQLSKQFIKAFDLPTEEVANFVAETVINWIKIACGVEVNTTVENNVSPQTFEDIRSLLQLTENAAHVGHAILEEVINLSKMSTHRSKSDLTCDVELLIHAHHYYTVACDVEGISHVLHFAKICTKTLAKHQLPVLMVRLLTGIGRFNEMAYVIETLYNLHHFEILCKQEHTKENQLKTALLEFLKRYHPKDVENFGIIARHFGMYREIAQHHESAGREKINTIKGQLSSSSKEFIIPNLQDISKTFSYAADHYNKDECFRHAHKCIRIAHLAELQIQLLPASLCILDLNVEDVQTFLKQHQNFLEAYIVADSYELSIPSIFVEALFHQVIIKGNLNYLQQFQSYFRLTAPLAMEIAVLFRAEKTTPPSANMKKIINLVRDMKTKLRIAKELKFTELEKELMDGPAGAYLRDITF